MADREVLREFLAKIGWQVDEPSLRRFVGAMSRTDTAVKSSDKGLKHWEATAKSWALRVSGSILGVATSSEAAVLAFSRGMEKMYYSSQRSQTTASNLAGLEFGFSQIGLEATDARSAVEALAAAKFQNPGLQALLGTFVGGETDSVKQLVALVTNLKKLGPVGSRGYSVAAQYAGMFGIPENVLRTLYLPGALDKMKDAGDRQREIYRALGVDQNQAAKTSAEYMNVLRELWMQVGAVSDKMMIALQPQFNQMHQVLSLIIGDLAHTDWKNLWEETNWKNLAGFIREQSTAWGSWGSAIRGVVDAVDNIDKLKTSKGQQDVRKTIEDSVRDSLMKNFGVAGAMAWQLYDLPAQAIGRAWQFLYGGPSALPQDATGVPDWVREKYGNKGPTVGAGTSSPSGAEHDPTLHYGTKKITDRERLEILMNEMNDPNRSMAWDSELRREIDRIKNGAPAGAGGGRASGAVGPVSLSQETNITVVASDAESAGRAVASAQLRVNRDQADAIRNLGGSFA